MNLNFLTILVCLAACSYGMDITNWDLVRNNLHRKLEEIYERDHDFVKKTVQVGKYFKYFVTSSDSGKYQVRKILVVHLSNLLFLNQLMIECLMKLKQYDPKRFNVILQLLMTFSLAI